MSGEAGPETTPRPVVAVVFDFDDTLVPDSTSFLLEALGIDHNAFWRTTVPEWERAGYDPPLAYLHALITVLPADVTVDKLEALGAGLDDTWFDGLPETFDDLKQLGRRRDVDVEFFIVSAGLDHVIGGSATVRDHFTAWYGCRLGTDEDGRLARVKRSITFTDKTRYLFEISKGITKEESDGNPALVNEVRVKRQIPFTRMLYVGDGLTDIPCISLLRQAGGRGIAVLPPPHVDQARRMYLAEHFHPRADATFEPDYRPTARLGAAIRTVVEELVARAAADALLAGRR